MRKTSKFTRAKLPVPHDMHPKICRLLIILHPYVAIFTFSAAAVKPNNNTALCRVYYRS